MGKKTAEEIHEQALRLRECRLEFVFRNEDFTKRMEDYFRTIEGTLVLANKIRSLSSDYGLQCTKDVDETDPPDLKNLKISLADKQRELDLQEHQVQKFLAGLNIYISGESIFPKLTPDYVRSLNRRGLMNKRAEAIWSWHPAKHEDSYIMASGMAEGVHLVSERRVTTKEDFEKITGQELKKKTYGKDQETEHANCIREVFPILMENFNKLLWTPRVQYRRRFWLSKNAKKEEIAEERKAFERWAGKYSKENQAFYRIDYELDREDPTKFLAPKHIQEKFLIARGRFVTVQIDITRTNEHLLAELEGLIHYCKTIIMEDELKLARRTQSLDLYAKYLKVWDLVQEKGKKWTEIAREIFPEDFIDAEAQLESEYMPNPETARIKVEQYYNAACRLIDEGLP